MLAIIPHHFGNHDLCLDCNFRIIQQENPTEPDATQKYLYAQSSRYGGQNMSLTNNGIEISTKVIMKRFWMTVRVFLMENKIFRRKREFSKSQQLVEENNIACFKHNKLSIKYSGKICNSFEYSNIKKGIIAHGAKTKQTKKELNQT